MPKTHIREVTKEEFSAELRHALALARASRRRWKEEHGFTPALAYFYGDANFVCSYTGSLRHKWAEWGKRFRYNYFSDVKFLRHRLEHNCNFVCPGTICECFAKVREDGKLKYYISEHEVGRCPFKRNPREHQVPTP